MDKKEKKRDISTFAHMMKDIMNRPGTDSLDELERDLQHFLFGRISVLVKHNDGQPIGTLGDVSAIIGAATADLIRAFCGDKLDKEQVDSFLKGSLANMVIGYQARAGSELFVQDTSTEQSLGEQS